MYNVSMYVINVCMYNVCIIICMYLPRPIVIALHSMTRIYTRARIACSCYVCKHKFVEKRVAKRHAGRPRCSLQPIARPQQVHVQRLRVRKRLISESEIE